MVVAACRSNHSIFAPLNQWITESTLDAHSSMSQTGLPDCAGAPYRYAHLSTWRLSPPNVVHLLISLSPQSVLFLESDYSRILLRPDLAHPLLYCYEEVGFLGTSSMAHTNPLSRPLVPGYPPRYCCFCSRHVRKINTPEITLCSTLTRS